MTARSLDMDELARAPEEERDPRRRERAEDELIMHLERDQLVVATSRPLPRAALSRRAALGLWALRAFVLVVSAMVIYAFVEQLG
jgi:hypothetical protein